MKNNKVKIFTIQNLFLFITIVILPLFVVYFSVSNLITNSFKADIEMASDSLRMQASKLQKLAKPQYQIRDFLNGFIKTGILRKDTKVINKVLKKIDKYYPGAFKWIFWNGKGNLLNINRKYMLQGRRAWKHIVREINEMLIYNKRINLLKDTKSDAALKIIQRALSKNTKVEQILSGRIRVLKTQWLTKKCLLLWDVDVKKQLFGKFKETYGGCLLVVFLKNLPDNFAIIRLVVRQKYNKIILPNPMLAVNLTERKLIAGKNKFSFSVKELINAYINKNTEVFRLKNYLVKGVRLNYDSPLIIFVIKDISEILNHRMVAQILLKIIILVLFILFTFYFKKIALIETTASLKQKIAFMFSVAVLLPVVGLLSIGQMFISHEEQRLIANSYRKMRNKILAVNLRYKDFPIIVEKNVYKELSSMIKKKFTCLEDLKKVLEKAVNQSIITNYLISDSTGKKLFTNWNETTYALAVKGIEIACRKLLKIENAYDNSPANLIKKYADKEFSTLVGITDYAFDIKRPSHLRYYCIKDTHMYVMAFIVVCNKIKHAVVVSLSRIILQRMFIDKEVANNGKHNNSATNTELSFYCQYGNKFSVPPDLSVYNKLNKAFKRVQTLQVEEKGEIKLNKIDYLYYIAPFSSANKPVFIPCVLIDKKPIKIYLYNLKIIIFAMVSMAIMATFIISLLLTSSLISPIKQIDKAAKEIGNGNLNVKLPDMGNDELGRLSTTFNNMVKGLKERERMSAYVSDSVLEAVKDENSTKWQKGSYVEASILFSDIRNFTSLSETHKPNEIFKLLNDFLGEIEKIIRKNGGRVDKYIGDAVMAVFFKEKEKNHALNAVKAATDMKKFLKEFNANREKRGLFTIDIGVGISSGKIMLGDIGSEKRKDLTVIGDQVNLASRLESASKKGRYTKIMLSKATYIRVKNYVEAELKDFTAIRGKKQPVEIYEIIRLINPIEQSNE